MTGHPSDIRSLAHRDPRAERSREALRTALTALLSEGPLEDVTILALTRRARVGYATFFRNYPDIESLLVELAGTYIAQLASLLAFDVDTNETSAVAGGIVAFVAKRRMALKPLFVGASDVLEQEIVARATAIARNRRLSRDSDVPGDLASKHAVRTVVTVLGWWLDQDDPTPTDVVAALIDRLALLPLADRIPTPR